MPRPEQAQHHPHAHLPDRLCPRAGLPFSAVPDRLTAAGTASCPTPAPDRRPSARRPPGRAAGSTVRFPLAAGSVLTGAAGRLPGRLCLAAGSAFRSTSDSSTLTAGSLPVDVGQLDVAVPVRWPAGRLPAAGSAAGSRWPARRSSSTVQARHRGRLPVPWPAPAGRFGVSLASSGGRSVRRLACSRWPAQRRGRLDGWPARRPRVLAGFAAGSTSRPALRPALRGRLDVRQVVPVVAAGSVLPGRLPLAGSVFPWPVRVAGRVRLSLGRCEVR